MTPYLLLMRLTGLAPAEAALFHDTRLDSVKSWTSGKRPVPAGVINELKELIEKQTIAANEILSIIEAQVEERGMPEEMELAFPAGDWPTKSVGEVVLARIIAGIKSPVKIILI